MPSVQSICKQTDSFLFNSILGISTIATVHSRRMVQHFQSCEEHSDDQLCYFIFTIFVFRKRVYSLFTCH